MRLRWGQGKIEVVKRRQEILDFLADGMTESEIFRRLKAKGLKGDKATFHRAIKHLKAEQQPAALPVPVPKSQAPKVSDQRSPSTRQPAASTAQITSESDEPSRSSLKTDGFQRPDPADDQSILWGE
jgi:hypothetical protein